MKHTYWILSKVKEAGYKLTKTRKDVGAWIENHDGVFSAKELLGNMPSLDSVSVYRTIDLLQSLDLIHQVFTAHGEVHYEVHGEDHHHHAVCTKCERAECVTDCSVSTKQRIKGFTNIHHTLVFTGLCVSCN